MDNQNMPPQGGNQMPPMGQPQPAPVAPENKSVGALIGSIIIVIILIIGGFYLWSAKVTPVVEPMPMMEQGMPVPGSGATEKTVQDQALNEPDPVLSQMAAVGMTDEVTSIDADLKATNLDNIDSGLQAE